MPDNNVTFTATWNELLACKVKYLEQGTDKELSPADTLYGHAGDVVTAKVIKVRKNLLIGRLEEITQRSPFRAADSFCAAPNACGGCAFRHLDYAYELSLKRELVRGEFVKNGMPDVEVCETVPTDDCRGYRNKGQYPVDTLKGHTVAGFYAVRSHNIIPFDGCAIQPDVFSQIVRFICAYADNAKISAYQEQTGKGILRVGSL